MVIEPAELDWPDGLPYSTRFGDIYFSPDNGLAETEHVFLDTNQLPERLAALPDHGAFTIAETGFGTGLNFLAAWRLWTRVRPETGWLHFVSVEKHPLTIADLTRALALWPELQVQAAQLLAQYPPLTAGWHRLCFPDERLTLTLLFGEANTLFHELSADVDAWFLDGFAPDRNPDLWQLAMLTQVARLSRLGATLATFTCAGVVRRALVEVGFQVSKVKGYGRKREMIKATLVDKPAPVPSWQTQPTCTPVERSALVIGAGIAGVSCARALALRGWRVTVLDQADGPMAAASGNPAAILYPKLASGEQSPWHFQQQAYLWLLGQLKAEPYRAIWRETGLLWLLTGKQAREGERLAGHPWPSTLMRRVSAEEASALAGVFIDCDCLYFPQAGFLRPQLLAQHWLDHPLIQCHWGQAVTDVRHDGESWTALAGDQPLARGAVVILATALAARQFAPAASLPLRPVRGQISLFSASTGLASLKTVLSYGGYLTPAFDGRHCLGATFLPGNADTAVTAADHAHNAGLLAEHLPGLASALPAQSTWQGRAALRAQTTDYMPLVGALPVDTDFRLRYAGLRSGQPVAQAPDYHPGLYVSLGHGSKGFCFAPLAAEILAAELNHEPCPVPTRTRLSLLPARFWIRELKRGPPVTPAN